MERELRLNSMDPVAQRLVDLYDMVDALRRDTDEIKLRLFNGLTDTVRETYAKVLILENTRRAHEDVLQKFQNDWAQEKNYKRKRDRLLLIFIFLSVISHMTAEPLSNLVRGVLKTPF